LELAALDQALILLGLRQHQLVFLALTQAVAVVAVTYEVQQLQVVVMVQPTLLVQMELLTQAAVAVVVVTAVLLTVILAVQALLL
jgi:hypothetical protein